MWTHFVLHMGFILFVGTLYQLISSCIKKKGVTFSDVRIHALYICVIFSVPGKRVLLKITETVISPYFSPFIKYETRSLTIQY